MFGDSLLQSEKEEMMIELPETYILAKQLNETVIGKTIVNVTANAFPHAFAFYNGEPDLYRDKLLGKKITEANPGTGYTCGGNTEIICEDMLLVISTPIKYHTKNGKLPAKHQLLIELNDGTFLSCTVQMWGAMICIKADKNDLPEQYQVNRTPDPMEDAFDKPYFDKLLSGVKPSLSVKAFLATEQRIPGLGNGVLQDILFNARIHPKTKLEQLSSAGIDKMYLSVKDTISEMTAKGGRNTEKDLFGNPGGYLTKLSSKTLKNPCPVCGDTLVREAYLGGNIYFCPTCQKVIK